MRATWIQRVKAYRVADLTYEEAAALMERNIQHREATGEDLPEYAAKLEAMRKVAAEREIPNTTGSICMLHALIAGMATR